MLMAASRFVSFQSGDLQLTGDQITISYNVADAKAVAIAAQTLSQDFQRVTGSPAQLTQNDRGNILVGTLGQSALIDRLVKQHKLDASLLKGKREKFVITLIDKKVYIPMANRLSNSVVSSLTTRLPVSRRGSSTPSVLNTVTIDSMRKFLNLSSVCEAT